MASRIRLYSKAGSLIYEVNAQAFREWVLNDIANASFVVKADGLEPYIAFGNYITIEDDKLDTWVGVITTPRPWSPHTVTVNAKSMMWLFDQRVGSYEQAVEGSWGAVFSQVIGIANNAEDTLMQIGDYDDGISYSSVVDMSNLYTYLQRALAQAQTRLDFRPVVIGGKLKIYVDMLPTLYTSSNLQLTEGVNIKNNSPVLIEQGEIYNDITILGVGLEQEKFTANAIDQVSIDKNGRRQKLFSEGQSQADVDRLATVRIAQYAYPRRTMVLNAMDKGNTFLNTRVGYSGPVNLNSVGYMQGSLGFRGTAFIRVIQFDDKTQEAVLVCEDA